MRIVVRVVGSGIDEVVSVCEAAPAPAPPASALQSAVDVCQCCGDALEPAPQLCDVCAPTFTEYAGGSAFCDRHEPEDDDCEDGEE